MLCKCRRYEPTRDGCDFKNEEDLNCPEEWKKVLAKKDEVILSLQNELLKRKLAFQEVQMEVG